MGRDEVFQLIHGTGHGTRTARWETRRAPVEIRAFFLFWSSPIHASRFINRTAGRCAKPLFGLRFPADDTSTRSASFVRRGEAEGRAPAERAAPWRRGEFLVLGGGGATGEAFGVRCSLPRFERVGFAAGKNGHRRKDRVKKGIKQWGKEAAG